MKVTMVSRETVSGIVKLYPHLKNHDVYDLFESGKLTSYEKRTRDWNVVCVERVYELEIPESVAALYNVDTKIELTTGEEGVFYSFTY